MDNLDHEKADLLSLPFEEVARRRMYKQQESVQRADDDKMSKG